MAIFRGREKETERGTRLGLICEEEDTRERERYFRANRILEGEMEKLVAGCKILLYKERACFFYLTIAFFENCDF